MRRMVFGLCAALLGAGPALADGFGGMQFTGTKFDVGGTYSWSGGTNVAGFDVSGITFLDTNIGFSLGIGAAHSSQTAFGLPFSATTISLHPGYEFPTDLGIEGRIGAYASATVTNTPAGFSPFFGYGLEGSVAVERFTFGGHLGLNSGANIATPTNNWTAGVFASYRVTDKVELYGSYDYDRWGFWALTVKNYQGGLRYDLSDFTGTENPASAKLSLGRLDVNGTVYTQIRFGVDIEIGGKGGSRVVYDTVPDHETRDVLLQQVSLRHTFSF